MAMKSPSKFVGLKWLLNVRENNYSSREGKIDWAPEEVDQLISIRYEKKQLLEERKRNSQIYRDSISNDFKYCGPCKMFHPLKQFGVRGKNNNLLRSMCKRARALKTATYRVQIKTPF